MNNNIVNYGMYERPKTVAELYHELVWVAEKGSNVWQLIRISDIKPYHRYMRIR